MPTYKEIKRTYNRLNDVEKLYAIKNAKKSFYISQFKNKAEQETFRRFRRVGHNDKSDAFRHCYWSALISRRYGYEEAIRVTTYHEVFPGNPFQEKRMDMHNNRVGAKIGRHSLSEVEVSSSCYDALQTGKLIYLNP